MSLKERMKTGRLYCESGHEKEEDKAYEKLLAKQRMDCKDKLFDFHHTRPGDQETRKRIMKELLAEVGEHAFFEGPVSFAYGCNTHIGDWFYANFNLCVVDDCEVFIGDHVMFGPNVTLSVTGHPLCAEYRKKGTQFSLPIHIGSDVWLGANVVVLPGVSIGEGSVIGAGSVVSKDIPDHVVAFGVPCKVVRDITDEDKLYYRKGIRVNPDWEGSESWQ